MARWTGTEAGPSSVGFATGRHTNETGVARREGQVRKQWVLAAMSLAFTMTMIDATIVAVALPTIQRDLDMSNTDRVWVVNAYLLAYTVTIAAGGKFADRVGQRHVFTLGLAIFTISSLIAGLSANGGMLIAARAAEGVGGALMTPTSQAMVTNAYAQRERGRALGIYTGVSALGVAIGPLLGGAITSFLDWTWIFFVNVPVGVVTFLLTRYANPPQSKAPHPSPVDWPGLVTLVLGLTAVVLAIMQSSSWGLGSATFLGVLAAGLILLAYFVWLELHRDEPLLRLRIFTNRDFLSDTLVTFLTRFALFGLSVYAPIFVQDVLGFSPFESGASTLPATVMLIVISPWAGKLYDRIGAHPLLSGGSLICVVGFALIAFVLPSQSYPALIPAYVVMGLGIGMLGSPALTDAMNVAPATQRGEAAGLLGTMQQFGATVGTAVLTALLVPLFLNRYTEITGAPATGVDSVLARTQGGATPSGVSPEVIAAAKEAFSWALSRCFFLVAVLMLMSFLIGFFLHTRSKPGRPAGK
jgi:EmrB/QacA subfamily drug resistance transporter